MQISRFEGRLLQYFFNGYLKPNDKTKNRQPANIVWEKELPKMWRESYLLKNCMLATACMFLESAVDIEVILREDEEPDKMICSGSTINSALTSIPQIDIQEVKCKSAEYAMLSIRSLSLVVQEIFQGRQLRGESEAAVLFFAEIMIYNLVMLHPDKLVAVLSKDKGKADLISICKGTRIVLANVFGHLRTATFGSIFAEEVALDITPDNFSELGRHLFHFLHVVLQELSEEQLQVYSFALIELEKSMYWIQRWNQPLCLVKWLFMHHEKFYEYLRPPEQFFALKLLYNYGCLMLCLKMRLKQEDNIWLDYLVWYKEYNLLTFGSWRDHEDDLFLQLVTDGFILQDMSELQGFLPSKYINWRAEQELTNSSPDLIGLNPI